MFDQSENLGELRQNIRYARYSEHHKVLNYLIDTAGLDEASRQSIAMRGTRLVEEIRSNGRFGLLEEFFKEYGLSTREGRALMRLAEAFMRVPDAHTKDLLIEDKLATSEWWQHFGKSRSTLINLSTLGLTAAGSVMEKSSSSLSGSVHEVIRKVGEPVIRTAIGEAMKMLGDRFVLGTTIEKAIERSDPIFLDGYSYSYDMLGEAARTKRDAERYFQAYLAAVNAVAVQAHGELVHDNPGISLKLSALNPRYEYAKKECVSGEIAEKVFQIVSLASEYKLGVNIDAEESERLDISLDIIEKVLSSETIRGWDGFGVVVQAYSPCAPFVIDWLYALTKKLDRQIMVRLVKGAYWDTEIKRAQMMGVSSFPVFTKKAATDISYIACIRKLLSMTDRIYPQFATHNAHTVCAVQHYREELGVSADDFEFQRLYGMGEVLHNAVMYAEGTKCRIYAPVGEHKELLAYLVRRLLENGANSSFINQIVDDNIAPEVIASDPFKNFEPHITEVHNQSIKLPVQLYEPDRVNARGWDLSHKEHVEEFMHKAGVYRDHFWHAGPMINGNKQGREQCDVFNPAHPEQQVGKVAYANSNDVEQAFDQALLAVENWSSHTMAERAEYLHKTANLLERDFGEVFALLIREAGKTYADCVAELREAVDFLRYYASESIRLEGYGKARGIIACISPWNFPLAIFTGQIAGALVAGNTVLAKPSNATSLIAAKVVSLFYEAGLPRNVLQLLPGSGSLVGGALASDSRVAGVCFTGSLHTAQLINRSLAEGADAQAMLIAETGGLNAMIVDSTALPEQAVADIIASAFQSAGQRCSALRMLYVQEDCSEAFLDMLYGAMDDLRIGDPWDISTDVGPVIDEAARNKIVSYIKMNADKGKVLKSMDSPNTGFFVGPTVIEVKGISELEEEIFGPVLHVASFKAKEVQQVINDINAKGYGLTFGLHSRIDGRTRDISKQVNVGNIYVNRNQIGAIVESQPFGGEGLSGTGPKAGGPEYIKRFRKLNVQHDDVEWETEEQVDLLDYSLIQDAMNGLKISEDARLHTVTMPGVTGELNTLSTIPRGKILCLGPTAGSLNKQISKALELGCAVLAIAPGGFIFEDQGNSVEGKLCIFQGRIDAGSIEKLSDLSAVCFWGRDKDKRVIKKALANREGCLIPLITEVCDSQMYTIERHVCVNTAAAGGDISLFAKSTE